VVKFFFKWVLILTIFLNFSVKTLEDRLAEVEETRAANQQVETLQNEIETLQKALQAQRKLTEQTEILKNSVDYEFEEFKKRLKNREIELTVSLERERDLNATYAEKIRNAEKRAMDADEAKEKLHQIMRAEALESAEQIDRLCNEVKVMAHRIQVMEKELADTEADRTKIEFDSSSMQAMEQIVVNCKKGNSSTATQTDAVSSPIGTTDSGVVLKIDNKRLNDELTRLQTKYEFMKRLCRMRKEEIGLLKEAILVNQEKENESTLSNGGASETTSNTEVSLNLLPEKSHYFIIFFSI